MKVTQIVEVSKTRSKVYIENEFAFVLYKGELRLYHIKEEEELSEENYLKIMEEVLPKRAKLRAMNLLKDREYTTAQLRMKLKQGLYPEKVIEQALSYVASFHYIDDFQYAVNYITCYEAKKSRKKIEQDLLGKGIDRHILEKAFREWEIQGGLQDEQSMIAKFLEKKNFQPQSADIKEKQKIYAFLMRKGFSSEQINKAIQGHEGYN